MASQIRVRPAAVAGLFYPDDPVALRSTVVSVLAARSRGAAGAPARRRPMAVIAPHAGYSYSGVPALRKRRALTS
jgi:MEMO1 family protein